MICIYFKFNCGGFSLSVMYIVQHLSVAQLHSLSTFLICKGQTSFTTTLGHLAVK